MAEPLHRISYWDYIRSSRWQVVRRRELERVRYICEDCSASNVSLQVHHLTYDRLGVEQSGDLRVLCHACHKRRHDGLEHDPSAPDWVRENPWLAKILKSQERGA